MLKNCALRLRAIELHAERVLAEIRPMLYLEAALGSDVAANLAGLSRPQLKRFVELVQREQDVAQWAKFVEHECRRAQRARTGWGLLESLPAALSSWNRNPAVRDEVVRRVLRSLAGQVPDPGPAEQAALGLRAFREMVWRLGKGER
jgi:hypothetical protein